MKVCFETFGCRLNRAEALADEVQFTARGWELTDSHKDAQLIIVRGCSVTARAQHDCERLIEHIKARYPNKRLIVTGCLPSADKNFFLKEKRILGEIPKSMGTVPTQPSGTVPTRTARAYLKVQDGCSSTCTFCIVPKFRGRAKSVPFNEVIDKAKQFIDAGYREIVVTGCNLVQYNSEGKKLPELVATLAGLSPFPIPQSPFPNQGLSPFVRIRLGSIEPGVIANELIQVMAENENICRFLHLSVQSGSAKILTAMHRPYRVREIDELVHKATLAMPNMGLGCDLITGFPGEMEFDHLASKGLLERLPWTKAHVFPYSERPGTVAAALPDKLPREIRHLRAAELGDISDAKRTKFARTFIGRIVEIVIEDEKQLSGWTSEYLWCRADGGGHSAVKKALVLSKRIHRKDLMKVRITDSVGHVLIGVPA